MTTRVYLPLRTSDLVALRDTGLVVAREAHAVTAELRAAWPEAGDDQWEWAALHAAAESGRSRWTGQTPRRRLVIAADVDSVEAGPPDDVDPTKVGAVGEVRLRHVAAIHVDVDDDADEGEELAWFATQELDAVIAALSDN